MIPSEILGGFQMGFNTPLSAADLCKCPVRACTAGRLSSKARG